MKARGIEVGAPRGDHVSANDGKQSHKEDFSYTGPIPEFWFARNEFSNYMNKVKERTKQDMQINYYY